MTNQRIEELYIKLEQASTVKEFQSIRDQINLEVIREKQARDNQNRRAGQYSGVVMNTITVMR